MIRKSTMFCYGFLAMPLAFVLLSLFVFIPKIYHEQYGIPVATIIGIFVVTKLVNFIALPFIGVWLDKVHLKRVYRKKIIYRCLPLLALSFFFLIFPPFESTSALIFFYLVTCMLYSVIIVNYYAMSVDLSRDYKTQNYISGYREMFTLFGFLIAALFPTILTQKYSFTEAYNNIIFILIFTLFTAGILLHFVKGAKHTFVFHPTLNLKTVAGIVAGTEMAKFLTVLFVNGISVALPVATAFYFIKYVLHAEDLTGYYLMTYYACGILSIPFWVKFSNRHGKKYSWVISMCVSSLFFFSAFFLGEGDRLEFYVICITTGFCLGADMCLSPSIYSDNVAVREKAGIYYSLWLLMGKVTMTLSMIIALTALGFYGLEAQPIISVEKAESGIRAISILHCLIPASLKLLAAYLLIRNKIDMKFKK